MKMKKLFLTIVVVALLLSTTVVNAATDAGTLTTEYESGDTITVTLTMADTENTDGTLNYDTSVLTLNSVSVDGEGFLASTNPVNGGVQFFVEPNSPTAKTFKTVTFTFTVSNLDENDGKEVEFSVEEFNPGVGEGTVNNDDVKAVKIVKKAEEVKPGDAEQKPGETTPTTPTNPTPAGDSETGSSATNGQQGTTQQTQNSGTTASAQSTNVPTVIPAAGVQYVAIGVGAAVIVLAVVALKIRNKRK